MRLLEVQRDCHCFLIDATKPVGRGDEWVANHVERAHAAFKLLVARRMLQRPEQMSGQLEAAELLLSL